jgi:formyltetrahydrofolate deformylase
LTAAGPVREIVLVDCPDEVGLIHRITGVLQALRLNIDTNHEYVDAAQRWFFFRAEVTPAAGPVAAADLERFLIAALPTALQLLDPRVQLHDRLLRCRMPAHQPLHVLPRRR